LEFYSDEELAQVLARAANRLDVDITNEALGEIASRSRGTPRIANRLLRRVRDFALVSNVKNVTVAETRAALVLYEVDALGLDRLDRQILTLLAERFAGRPVGLSTLAVAVGEEQDTIESVVEPFLVRQGLISRTPRGRQATELAFRHLGLPTPELAE
jgi:Holliday junction DNA helicase RuvB